MKKKENSKVMDFILESIFLGLGIAFSIAVIAILQYKFDIEVIEHIKEFTVFTLVCYVIVKCWQAYKLFFRNKGRT